MPYVREQSGGTTYSDIISPSTSNRTKVTCGFKPNYIICISSTPDQGFLYDADYSTTVSRGFNGDGNENVSLGDTRNGQLYSIDNDGFTMNKVSTSRTYYIFASK